MKLTAPPSSNGAAEVAGDHCERVLDAAAADVAEQRRLDRLAVRGGNEIRRRDVKVVAVDGTAAEVRQIGGVGKAAAARVIRVDADALRRDGLPLFLCGLVRAEPGLLEAAQGLALHEPRHHHAALRVELVDELGDGRREDRRGPRGHGRLDRRVHRGGERRQELARRARRLGGRSTGSSEGAGHAAQAAAVGVAWLHHGASGAHMVCHGARLRYTAVARVRCVVPPDPNPAIESRFQISVMTDI
jgi:hypothetical protein